MLVSVVFFSLVVSLVAVRGAEAQVARGRLNKWDVAGGVGGIRIMEPHGAYTPDPLA